MNSQRIPDNALLGSKYINVENGIISSNLGKKISEHKEKTIIHVKITECDNIDLDDDDIADVYYFDDVEILGPMLPPQVSDSKLTVELTLDGSDTPIIYENLDIKIVSHDDLVDTYEKDDEELYGE